MVADPAAGPLWAHFYELGTNRPVFAGRDKVIRYAISEIEHERRNGYSYYGTSPASLLAKDYPRWRTKTQNAQWNNFPDTLNLVAKSQSDYLTSTGRLVR